MTPPTPEITTDPYITTTPENEITADPFTIRKPLTLQSLQDTPTSDTRRPDQLNLATNQWKGPSRIAVTY